MDGPGVVDVEVGGEHGDHAQFAPGELLEDRRSLIARIDDEHLAARLVAHDVAVRLERPDDEALQQHARLPSLRLASLPRRGPRRTRRGSALPRAGVPRAPARPSHAACGRVPCRPLAGDSSPGVRGNLFDGLRSG